MQQILSFFWRICLFRAGPETIPKSVPITVALLTVNLLLASIYVFVTRAYLAIYEMFAVLIIGLFIETAILYAVLAFKAVTERFLSTLCALLGSNSIFLALLLPMQIMVVKLEDGLFSDFLVTLSIFASIWWLIIVGFILHRATSISILQGTALAFIIELLVALTTTSIFPYAS